MFYVQLKSIVSSEVTKLRVYPRFNVEKLPLTRNRSEYRDIDVISFRIDVSDLLTIQAMGATMPVLLVLVTLDTKSAYFLCLNDHIDKVILPEDPNFHDQETKTIYVPALNTRRHPAATARLAVVRNTRWRLRFPAAQSIRE